MLPLPVSRLNCVFAMRTLDQARLFRDRFRNGNKIYQIECEDDVPLHEGSYDAITNGLRGVPFIELMTDRSVSYWRDSPSGISEILIGGQVTITREIE